MGEGRAQLPQRQHVPLPMGGVLAVAWQVWLWGYRCGLPQAPPTTHTEPLHSGKGGCTCCVSQLVMQGLGARAHTLALERAQWVRGSAPAPQICRITSWWHV